MMIDLAVMTRKSWFLISLLSITLCGNLTAQGKYRTASVCEILDNPSVWNGRTVTIEANLVIARPHGIFLVDEHCVGKHGLQLDYPSIGADQSVSNLDRLIMSGDLLHGGTGTFVGVLKRDKGKKRPYLWLLSVLQLKSETLPKVANPVQGPTPTSEELKLR